MVKKNTDNTEVIQKIDKRKSLPQLFKKGHSGNPAGKPKGTVSITAELKKKLLTCPKGEKKTYLELITERIIYMAGSGNEQMLKLIINYTDGMPIQKLSGDPDNPIIVQFSKQDEKL